MTRRRSARSLPRRYGGAALLATLVLTGTAACGLHAQDAPEPVPSHRLPPSFDGVTGDGDERLRPSP